MTAHYHARADAPTTNASTLCHAGRPLTSRTPVHYTFLTTPTYTPTMQLGTSGSIRMGFD